MAVRAIINLVWDKYSGRVLAIRNFDGLCTQCHNRVAAACHLSQIIKFHNLNKKQSLGHMIYNVGHR